MRIRTAVFVTGAVAALGLAAVPATAHAFGHFGQPAGADGALHIVRMAKTLGLSDEQIEQLQAIATKADDGAARDNLRSMRAARQALAGTVHDPSATDEQVRGAAAAVAALEAQAAVQRHRTTIQVLKVLTPEQEAKLEELRASFKASHGGPRHGAPSEN